MWKTTIITWSYVYIEGNTEFKKCKINFEFEKLEEAMAFIEIVKEHSDVVAFELEYVKKVVE